MVLDVHSAMQNANDGKDVIGHAIEYHVGSDPMPQEFRLQRMKSSPEPAPHGEIENHSLDSTQIGLGLAKAELLETMKTDAT